MTLKEKLNLLEDILDIGKDSLSSDTLLSSIQEWDSMAVVSMIAVTDNNFGKKLTGAQIKEFTKINDIIAFWDG